MRTPPGGGLAKASLDAPMLLERVASRAEVPADLLAFIGELLDVGVYLERHAGALGAAQTLHDDVIAVLVERLAAKTDAGLPRELKARLRDSRPQPSAVPQPKAGMGVSMRGKRR